MRNTKTFDISCKQDVIDGKVRIETQNGKCVEILKWDLAATNYPIVACIDHKDICRYNYQGFADDPNFDNPYGEPYGKLVIVSEYEPRFKVGDTITSKHASTIRYIIDSVSEKDFMYALCYKDEATGEDRLKYVKIDLVDDWGVLVNDDDKEQKPVYVIYDDIVADYDDMSKVVCVTTDIKTARQKFDSEVKKQKELMTYYSKSEPDYEDFIDNETHFSCWKSGYYSENHADVILYETYLE